MPLSNPAAVTVDATRDQLLVEGLGGGAPGTAVGVTELFIQNVGAADVFVGGPGVTTTNGIKVKPDSTLILADLGPGDAVHAVCATTSEVRLLVKE